MTDVAAVLDRLKAMGNAENAAGMARFGINPDGTLGISVADLRKIARELGRDHNLAEALWQSGIHEARILAVLVDDPKLVTEDQAERWVADIDSWDVCDQLCMGLLRKAPFAHAKAKAWCKRKETFVRRAGFALIATLAVHDKKAPDKTFAAYLPLIRRAATDERNFVKKAVNWALRQIGKRNPPLNAAALALAEELVAMDDKTARWIGRDAHRELTSDAVKVRLDRTD